MMRQVTLLNHPLPEIHVDLNAIARICFVIGLVFSTYPILSAGAVSGKVHDVYLITDVFVDVTAATAADARRQALELGHRKASDRLIKRLVPARQRNFVPEIERPELDLLIKSYSVDEEKRSAIRYIGTLRFQFRRAEVRRFLRTLGVGFAETRSKPVLVIPVFEIAGVTLLWDAPNPWLSAWRNLPVSDGLVSLRVPSGTLLDIRDLSAQQAVSGNFNQLRLVAKRYGSGSVVVANASLKIDLSTGKRSIFTSLKYLGGVNDRSPDGLSFAWTDKQTIEDVINFAAKHLSTHIEETWKKDNVIRFNELNNLITNVSFENLTDWVNIRARLFHIGLIKAAQVISISHRRILLKMVFFGDPDQLSVALAQHDLSLKKVNDKWLLEDLLKTKFSTKTVE